MTKTAKLSEADLMQFTGSENWYWHARNSNILFTDGAKHVADEGGAHPRLRATDNSRKRLFRPSWSHLITVRSATKNPGNCHWSKSNPSHH
jgi:hypothetical protein